MSRARSNRHKARHDDPIGYAVRAAEIRAERLGLPPVDVAKLRRSLAITKNATRARKAARR